MTSTPDEWTELERLARAANEPRVKHADQLSAYADWLKFAGSAKPQVILQLIAIARSERVLREAISYRNLDLSSDCPSCNAGSVRIDLVEALAESDRLRAGAEGEKV